MKNGAARYVLELGDLDKPAVGRGQVLVHIRAIGVNPSDTKARATTPLASGIRRVIPHQDGAGIIEAVGEGVPTSRIGERVWIYEALFSGGSGCAAEYIAVPSVNAVPLPGNISFEGRMSWCARTHCTSLRFCRWPR